MMDVAGAVIFTVLGVIGNRSILLFKYEDVLYKSGLSYQISG